MPTLALQLRPALAPRTAVAAPAPRAATDAQWHDIARAASRAASTLSGREARGLSREAAAAQAIWELVAGRFLLDRLLAREAAQARWPLVRAWRSLLARHNRYRRAFTEAVDFARALQNGHQDEPTPELFAGRGRLPRLDRYMSDRHIV
ncbi:hypothetical protein [Streptacidiphilus sp. EB103A]|uniref:hypothetical protein n=1 Tax=Streptacidiphilus sp. EB103A TaxID=3156275 RepID=UPI00351232D2